MDIGSVGLWTFILDNHPTDVVRDIARDVEQMGWPTLWRPESRGRDALISSAVVLEATTSLNMATGIAITYARHPMTASAAQKSLNEAYDNRFLLGLGVSHAPSIEGVRKMDYSTPYSDMVAYLKAMVDAPYGAPEPSEPPKTVLAALGPRMLELSAKAADGAHPYFTPVEHTGLAREIMGEGPLLAPEIMVSIDDDVDAARDLARPTMQRYLSLPNYKNNLIRLGYHEADLDDLTDEVVDAIVACGPLSKTVERVQEHQDAGADHVCIQVLVPDGDLDLSLTRWREIAEAFGLS